MRALRFGIPVAFLLSACGTNDSPPRATAAPLEVSLKASGLSALVAPDGVRLELHTAAARLSTRAVGRLGAMSPTTPKALRKGERTVIERAGLREWWTSDGKQLEFGYDVAERPKGEGPLRVVVHTEGDGTFRVSSEGAVAFLDGPGGSSAAPLLELLDLHARDASGRALPARFALDGGDLSIVVDDANARYPIVIDPIVATGIETKLSLTGTSAPNFGGRIALSADGNHLLVKDPNTTSVVFYDYAAGTWSSPGSVKFPTASGGTEDYNAFGDALAFAADDTALVTDYRFNYSGMGWAGGVFAFDGKPSYLSTIKQSPAAANDQFGFSMAASGNDIIVGARSTSGFAAAAYVFTHTSGSTYTQQAKLPQPTGTQYFGWTVAIQGDLAVVGVLTQRMAYAFRRTGTKWDTGSELKAKDALVSADGYGLSFAVGGKTLLVGAPGKKITAGGDGQVYVFTDAGTSFTEESPMFAAPLAGAEAAGVGGSIALTPDGNTAFVSATGAAGGQGRVYVMRRAGTTWNLIRTIAPSDPTTKGFGSPLALAGTRLAVGAPTGPTGFVYVYDPALGLDPAAKCTGPADCASGFCADGVCCDTACTGTCEACNVAGKEGTCTAVKGVPVAPREACPAMGTGECASTCDGATRASCTMPTDTTTCGTASCDATGKVIAVGHCDGAGSCTPPAPASCAPYVCEGGACKTSCKLDTECADGARCKDGACVVGLPEVGPVPNLTAVQPCKADTDCATGHCSDGVCCDQACKDKCSSCIVPGLIGKCVAESGIDMRNDCNAASCTTTCQAGDCRSVRAGDQCAPALCIDDHTAQGPSTCSAAGSACGAVTGTLDCSPYACALGACLTSCVDSSQCTAGTVCDTSSQHCVAPPQEDSGSCALGEPGGVGAKTCAWMIAALALVGAVRRKRG